MRQLRLLPTLVCTAFLLTGVAAIPSSTRAVDQTQKPKKDHPFQIKKQKGEWKVVDETDSTNTVIRATKGDMVTWKPIGSDVVFQFPDTTLFGTYGAEAKAGKKVSLEVRPDAKPGRYVYSVFCLKDGKFATGNSPPVIIID